MWQSLHDAWWRLATHDHPRSFPDVLAARVLDAGSVLYRGAVGLRNAAYDQGWARPARLPARVVSVGNLTVGGTGKTACVELIAKKLLGVGKRVAVLSRGYGGARRGPYALRCERGELLLNGGAVSSSDSLADEPQLLARRLPGVAVLVGPHRAQTGRQACADFRAEAVILDDGFQHRQLHRDCDIVLVHARMPLAGGRLLPRGPWREPLGSLKRAQVIMITKADDAWDTLGALSERLRSFNPHATVVTTVHRPIGLWDPASAQPVELTSLQDARVGLVSSIGDPQGFEATLERLHAQVLWHDAYPDHHRYRPEEWRALMAPQGRARPQAIVTTEKDWVRLQQWSVASGQWPVPIWILQVQMKIHSGEHELDARLAGLWVR